MLNNQSSDTGEERQLTSGSAQNPIQSSQEKQKPARSLLIDTVRGMAISLVVLGHTNQGMTHRGWWGASSIGTRLDITIYAFHMPAFFFVSGIFLCASVAKRGPGRFTVERFRTLIYPYVLWMIISAGSVHVLSRFTAQQPQTPKVFLLNLVEGAGIWFLPALFVCQMLGMLLRKLPGAAITAIAVLAYYVVPHTGVVFLDQGIQFFPFVSAGMWVGFGYEKLKSISRRLALALALLLLVALLADTWDFWWPGYHNNVLLGGVIGTAMLMMLARSFGSSRVARAFAWAGEASLAIYLAGEYGQGLVRLALQSAHIIEPYTQLILPTIAAIVIPAWVYQHRVRLHLEWLFLAPFWKQKPRTSTASV